MGNFPTVFYFFNTMKIRYIIITIVFILSLLSCKDPITPLSNTYIETVLINGKNMSAGSSALNIPVDSVVIQFIFSSKIDKTSFNPDKLFVLNNEESVNFEFLYSDNENELKFKIKNKLNYLTKYTLVVQPGENFGVNIIDDFQVNFLTEIDPTPKFPVISNDSLLTLVQKQTFKYFWDYGHPVSGLARERLGSDEIVTTGGSGFGLMAILVGIERGFITRQQGFERFDKIVNFLANDADKFHGAFPHWLNGTTGKTQPFSTKDDGADLVETSFLIAGLLAVQSYFSSDNVEEQSLCAKIQQIWENVEWTWFQRNGEPKLYWHWSSNYQWDMNMPIAGWNEGLITYVLAAASPTYSIAKNVYTEGWTRNGSMKNGNKYYEITLPLGERLGGPLFFSHYSFLGLDPRNLQDEYANYWLQNTAHTKINYNYCVTNPRQFLGYSNRSWGLSASDIPNGYTASSPTNDNGTITPTAALSSFPYTPEESMRALNFYYYVLGDKLWGEYGFKDAFNLTERWFADSYLAINQGPIVVMIENYRTELIWSLFMERQDIKNGLTKLGFTY